MVMDSMKHCRGGGQGVETENALFCETGFSTWLPLSPDHLATGPLSPHVIVGAGNENRQNDRCNVDFGLLL
jgi:hypothetical protein